MSTTNKTEIDQQDWTGADRLVARLIGAAAVGFILGSVVVLWS